MFHTQLDSKSDVVISTIKLNDRLLEVSTLYLLHVGEAQLTESMETERLSISGVVYIFLVYSHLSSHN